MMLKLLPTGLLIAVITGFLAFFVPTNLGKPLDQWISGLINTFSYFTIQSNLIVGMIAVAAMLNNPPQWLLWWRRDSVKAGATLYISVTGLVHFLLLEGQIDYSGWSALGNVCHHYLTPIAMPIYWFVSREPGNMRTKNIPGWLAFPVGYLTYSLLRGLLVGHYPYFFLDVAQFGYGQIAINCVLLTVFFAILASVLITVDRRWGNNQPMQTHS